MDNTTHRAAWLIAGEEASLIAATAALGDKLKDGDQIRFDTGEVYRIRRLGSETVNDQKGTANM